MVNVTVDQPPATPQALHVSAFPAGNILNISWSPNSDETMEYTLYYRKKGESPWRLLANLQHPICKFDHTDLKDGQEYEYHLNAVDHRKQVSAFSEVVTGIPEDTLPPAPPTGLKVIHTTYNSIKLIWQPNTDQDLEGYKVYRSNVSF